MGCDSTLQLPSSLLLPSCGPSGFCHEICFAVYVERGREILKKNNKVCYQGDEGQHRERQLLGTTSATASVPLLPQLRCVALLESVADDVPQ